MRHSGQTMKPAYATTASRSTAGPTGNTTPADSQTNCPSPATAATNNQPSINTTTITCTSTNRNRATFEWIYLKGIVNEFDCNLLSDETQLCNCINIAVSRNYGISGSAGRLDLLSYDTVSKTFILRVDYDYAQIVASSLPTITSYAGHQLTFSLLMQSPFLSSLY